MGNFTYTFHFFIVALSIFMVVSYAYTAFDFHERSLNATYRAKRLWVIGSSITLGSGIWILYYIGLHGYSSNITSQFDTPRFIMLSFMLPLLGSIATFFLLSLKLGRFITVLLCSISLTVTLLALQLLSSVFILGISYSLGNVWQLVVTAFIALFSSFSSFWIVYGMRNEKRQFINNLVGALVIGLGIASVHYFSISYASSSTSFNLENYSENSMMQYLVLTAVFIVTVLLLISVVRDRKLALKTAQLRESERRYLSLVENNPDGIMLVDLEGMIININPALEKISGYTLKEATNLNCYNILSGGTKKRTMKCFIEVKRGVSQKCESAILHKMGHSVKVRLIMIPHVIDASIKGVIVIVEDITEIKETEELLRKSEKLTAVGELAAGVGHEIRNPLTSLKGFANILSTSTTDVKSKEFLQIMLSEIDRINVIVSEFMLLARPHDKEFARCDLISLLRHVVTLLKTQAILNDVVIRTHYEFDRLLITCEENQIKQVFVNLIKNAIEAMPDGGIITVKVLLNEENEALVSITDQGVGISDEQLKRIGEPFYTLKENGTGLGMMVSFNIIENHGGTLQLTSSEGKGTTVEVVLPSVEENLIIVN
ncbi:ATP-binding protein [Alkalihalobacillus sp. CinArs1]|uniref:ATP-binding protein n=1 Tax=Alkalihalobacillus sp. CinArs1 TaxID=2995314 RepID=UPI0022DD5A8B|nr:ATP-binding protein [Alkalihalobacillus sp. CinArs1]